MKRIKNFIEKYERHIGPAALIFGFIFDSLTLGRPDELYGHIIFLTYLSISAFGIILLAIFEKLGKSSFRFLLALIQFSFGNLAGGLLFFYGQSGSFEGSILFFVVFGAFIIGNEFVRNYYERMNFHISAWFFLALSYSALSVPIILGKIGTGIFILSTLVALFSASLLIYAVYLISPHRVVSSLRKLIYPLSAIFLIYNFFYFSNILPPVPLSLTHIGIYHYVEKTIGGNFKVSYEKPKWFQVFKKTSNVFIANTSSRAYCFSSIYAPVKIRTEVSHRWEYFDEESEGWQRKSFSTYEIIGGRYEGYRLYSIKSGLVSGKWRCSVEDSRGTLIGQTTFKVLTSGGAPSLEKGEL